MSITIIPKLPTDYDLEVTQNNISGVSYVNKFGAAIDGLQTTATDIWDLADSSLTQQIWVAPTQARIHDIASTSASDDGSPVGVGARTIRIYGLQTWDSKESSEDITLNGVSNVATANSYVIIHRMKVLTSGASGPNVGDITATAQTDGTVTAQITATKGQTLMAVYGIPSTQTAQMSCFYFNLHSSVNPATAAEATYSLLVNESPDTDETIFLVKHIGGIISLAQNHVVHCFKPYKLITGPAIIKMQGIGNAGNLYSSAGFDLYIVDN